MFFIFILLNLKLHASTYDAFSAILVVFFLIFNTNKVINQKRFVYYYYKKISYNLNIIKYYTNYNYFKLVKIYIT